ncbi:MAG: Crp/Fnr family transcriptional regulator [Sediminibacterium sp.]
MLDFIHFLNRLAPLSPTVQAAFIACMRKKELRRGQLWLQEGGVNDKIGFIEEGLLKQYSECGSKEVVMLLFKEQQMLFSAKSFFEQEPSAFAIRAVEPSTIWWLSYTDLQGMVGQFPELNVHLRLILQQKFSADEAHVELLLRPPQQRFFLVHKVFPWIKDHPLITDRLIAGLIGVTPVCFSKYRNGGK